MTWQPEGDSHKRSETLMTIMAMIDMQMTRDGSGVALGDAVEAALAAATRISAHLEKVAPFD